MNNDTKNIRRDGARAIETHYAGCRFRSRLEARWAVAFDAMGVVWRYETEGYDLSGQWYLPDFLLPQRHAWIEVKPDLTTADLTKAVALARDSHEPVLCLGDIPSENSSGPHHVQIGYNRTGLLSVEWFAWLPSDPEVGGVIEEPHGYSRFIGDDNCIPSEMWRHHRSQVRTSPFVASAYREARSARFEHDARGRQASRR